MSKTIEKTKQFVEDLFSNKLDSNFLYHNLRHTQRVVKSTKELSDANSINESDKEVLILAAWLHDTGYTKGTQDHEENSCKIAKEFLKNLGYDSVKIESIITIILATKRYYEPKNLEEQIIRDADSSHFGQKTYAKLAKCLKMNLQH